MPVSEISILATNAVKVALLLILPMCLSAMVVGVIVSMLQAVTQIQEITLTFIPKMIVILLTMVVFMPFMSGQLSDFYMDIMDKIVKIIP